ncbi:VCBS repeat-containing protein [Aquimarina sp. U1-2]|uniref:RHS repeat-associated core domain-containing protein n=1 Tax=Aquimarina sp. U1-2 TaxID=2823141 RepID=UPI001AECA48A|nr:RHS repeat-associated core domain-containing protein [Aquimarina sp. U1-2]MBP2831950.1 VCBS repeat-containing protein [Aquimarina sp. U1-2]
MNFKSFFWISVLICALNSLTAQIDVGTTAASLEVSPTGALTYNIPIAIPPGVGDTAPGISLAYSSQSGNGIAGWGWNITGLSAITRTGTSLVHEGFVSGVDFQLNDRFALDGQKLFAVSGQNGRPNSQYATENHSNLKIVAYGTNKNGANCGPDYFKVFHPDGTVATYKNVIVGAVHNNEVAEWPIHQMEDAQGNRINYFYHETNADQLLRIKKITYGGPRWKREGHPNIINFYYKTRKRVEIGYAPGELRSRRANILDKIEVISSGKLYRKYNTKHKVLKNNYELIEQIQESNGDGKVLKPIVFTYPIETSHNLSSDREVIETDEKFYGDTRMVAGDFDGDTKMDFILYNKDKKSYLQNHLKKRGYENNVRTNIENFHSISSAVFINDNGEISKKQQILTLKRDRDKLIFRGFLSDHQGKFNKVYNKTFKDPSYIPPQTTEIGNINVPINLNKKKELLTGNFTGEGLTTAIFYPEEGRNIYFADLQTKENNISLQFSGKLDRSYEKDKGEYFQIADYNGDGKDDIWMFEHNHISIYTLNTNKKLTLINEYRNENRISLDKHMLVGDFNGDGKADLMIPHTQYKERWLYLFSKGNDLTKKGHDGGAFQEKYVNFDHLRYSVNKDHRRSYYIVQDFDGDGKTDILRQVVSRSRTRLNQLPQDEDRVEIPRYNWKVSLTRKIQLFINSGGDEFKMNLESNVTDVDSHEVNAEGAPYNSSISAIFGNLFATLSTNSGYKGVQGIPVFLDVNMRNPNKEFVFAYGDKLYAYSLTKDHQKDVQIQKIENNLITQHIHYDRMEPGNNTYTEHSGAKYPFVNVNNAPGTTLVKRIIETGSGITRKRDFKYEGAVSHLHGYGFIGFRYLKSTDWYGDNTPVIWNISKYELTKTRGAVEKSWRSLTYNNNPSDAINRMDYTYLTKYKGNVFINKPKIIKTTDHLLGFSATEELTYDQFYNPTKIIVKNPTATKTTTFTYSNLPSVNDHSYHIGRKRSEETTKKRGNSTKKHRVLYEYYSGAGKYGLINRVKRYHNNVEGIRDIYYYDSFGNVIAKRIATSGVPDRRENFKYSADGRFMISKTDLEGQTVTYKYDTFSGNPISSTDHLDQTITTQYDGWGRAISETNYLNKKTLFSYSYKNNNVRSAVKGPDGSESFKETNAFGQEVLVGSKSFSGAWVFKHTRFDASGRKTRESEPRFGSDAYQWNIFAYDQYGRMLNATAYTGQIASTSYNGLRVTVDDGTKTVTTVKDHENKTNSVTDPGGTIYYTYDADGNLIQSDYDGYKIAVTYDALGRKTKLTDPSAGTYTYTYDNYNQLLSERSPKGETTYTYDDFGKVLTKKIKGDLTDITESYTYDAKSKQVTSISAKSNGENFTYTYNYDRYYRAIKVTESNNKASFNKWMYYDAQGRVYNEVMESIVGGNVSKVNQQSIYGQYGHLIELRSNGKSIWKLGKENAKGQVEKATLGNDIVQNTQYDALGFVKEIKDARPVNNGVVAMHTQYTFEAKTGLLKQRNNFRFGGVEEKFTYDNLKRLKTIRGSLTKTMEYDPKGRITQNSDIGAYSYPSANSFQLAGIDLNQKGDAHYASRPLHQMTFNAFKKPVTVSQQGYGKITYGYNPSLGRSHAYYGNEEEDAEDRKYHKHYSSIFPGEVVENKENSTAKFITYLGGDAYTAVAAQIKVTKGQNVEYNSINYLHRDYLGSIMAITDANRVVRERMHYGAWGTVERYYSKAGVRNFGYESILQRGYTGHEHFEDVGLIHMNGRMYDANLGRFLSPDNYVQDPSNTQNFNRYGYAYNNPLMYTDPSGEFFFAAVAAFAVKAFFVGAVTAFIAGGIQGVVVNGIFNMISGQPFFAGAGSAFIFGGISAVLSNGIGNLFRADRGGIFSKFENGFWHQAAHGAKGGVMTQLYGGDFNDGFVSGFVGHSIADFTGALTKEWNTIWKATTQIGSGALAGGLSSQINGGSFKNGFKEGLTSAAFNAAFVPIIVQGLRFGFTRLSTKLLTSTSSRAVASGSSATGVLISRGNRSFSSFNRAVEHYRRHSSSIKNALGRRNYSLSNYIDDANYIINHGRYVPELHGYVSLVGGTGSAKYAFVGLNRSTNNITTFHIKPIRRLVEIAPSLGLR